MSLPENYTRLRYIESSGTQYIDTGFKPNNNTRVILEAAYTGDRGANAALFGGRASTSDVNAFALWWFVTSSASFRFDYSTGRCTGDTPSDGVKTTADANKNIWTLGDHTETMDTATFQCEYNLCLFAVNTAGTVANNFTGRLYSCQIYDNDTLIRDFVPCKDADGVAGLYDTVNAVFYTDGAGGTFTAGAEAVPDYKIVDANTLDYALAATADAIRTKNGSSEKIAWDEESGFASAISDMSGSNIVTGTFTISSSDIYSTPITVSGLGFKPSTVILDSQIILTGPLNKTLFLCEEGVRSRYRYFQNGNYGEDEKEYFTLTINDDGFTLSGLQENITKVNTGTWNYIAIG